MKERLVRLLNNPRRVPVIIGTVAFGTGVGLGYILGKRTRFQLVKITDRLEIDPKEEVVNIKQNVVRPPPVVIPAENHPTFNKPIEETPAPMSVVHNSEATAEEIPYHKVIDDDKDDPQPVEDQIVDKGVDDEAEKLVENSRRLLFAENSETWNYDSEIQKRNPSLPYIIHKDEFFADEMHYAQVTLTYYAGDNIMVDEDEAPIYNHETVVGALKFGHGSDDPNVVYVRNDKRKAEYEILYDTGMYSVEVLGLSIDNNERARDIKHSKTRKFRPE